MSFGPRSNHSYLSKIKTDPGAAGGLELDSDFIESVAKESSNICGVKLTYGFYFTSQFLLIGTL
jgi:hypothetical protein